MKDAWRQQRAREKEASRREDSAIYILIEESRSPWCSLRAAASFLVAIAAAHARARTTADAAAVARRLVTAAAVARRSGRSSRRRRDAHLVLIEREPPGRGLVSGTRLLYLLAGGRVKTRRHARTVVRARSGVQRRRRARARRKVEGKVRDRGQAGRTWLWRHARVEWTRQGRWTVDRDRSHQRFVGFRLATSARFRRKR